MDFNFTPEDEAFRQELRSWLEKNAPKGLENSDSLAEETDDDADWNRRVAWFKKLQQAGMGRYRLAQRIRRTRRFDPADDRLLPGARARQGSGSLHRARAVAGRAHPDALGERGTEETLYS